MLDDSAEELVVFHCGNLFPEIPESELPLVAEVHMEKYWAFEFACHGNTREHGYLAVDKGKKIWMLSSSYAGHAGNIFSAYVYCACGKKSEVHEGWLPTEASS
jgi:hypothetical protein